MNHYFSQVFLFEQIKFARHLNPTELEDCESEFVLHMLMKSKESAEFAHKFHSQPMFASRCTRNFIIDYLRKISLHPTGSLYILDPNTCEPVLRDIEDMGLQPEAALMQKEFLGDIVDIAPNLSKTALKVLRLYYEGMTHAEIAKALCKTIGAIKMTYSRTIDAIEKACKAQGIDAREFGSRLTPPPAVDVRALVMGEVQRKTTCMIIILRSFMEMLPLTLQESFTIIGVVKSSAPGGLRIPLSSLPMKNKMRLQLDFGLSFFRKLETSHSF